MAIWISRYSNKELQSSKYYPVGISIGTPKFPLGYTLRKQCYSLAPKGYMLNMELERFKPAYYEKLEGIGTDRIIDMVQRMDEEARAEGKELVLTAVIFRADFGPLNEAIELSAEDGYEGTFGTALTTDAMKEAIAGGAKTIIACRVGNGGTQGSIKLQDSESTDAVSITAKYPGAKDFVVTVREKLSDSTLKECIFYAGTTEFEKVEFAAGTDEANALVDALASSKNFKAEVIKSGTVTLQNVSQSQFTKGTDPQVTNGDYSNAFKQVEAYEFNTICVDTEDIYLSFIFRFSTNE